jgi:molecular chaperone Hsp33
VWQEILKRRAENLDTGAHPEPVRHLLGEMTAAAVLMQSNIKFNGALVMQIFGDGPLKLAVVEVQPNLNVRATAKVVGDLDGAQTLSTMVNVKNEGRCAITLDPLTKLPGQQPYQGVVPLFDDRRNKLDKFSEVLQHYMLQSEQLDTTLVLAADDKTAAGLLIQRLPIKGEGNLAAKASMADEDEIGRNEDYNRISILAASLKNEELLQLDADTILRRLFWEEKLKRLETLAPSFACSCSRDRVSNMIRSLGADEVDSILSERNDVEVGCDFCGQQYRFDAVDAAQIFTSADKQVPGSSAIQ